MYRYKKLLVGIDFSERDASLIRYASLISKLAQTERIYFVHVADNLELPNDILKEYPELAEPLDEYASTKMQEVVKKYYNGRPETELLFEVVDGKPVDELLKRSRQKDVDLIIVARKNNKKSGILAEKLARKANCSVLVVPENSTGTISHILVGLDFSTHALDAADVGTAFASALALKSFHGVHVYQVPQGFYKTGKNYDEFAKVMLTNAEKNHDEFISKASLKGVNPEIEFVLSKDISLAIRETATKSNADLVVMGTRGKSAGASILLGSITENLIINMDVPVLAVKQKGVNVNILNALFTQGQQP